MQSSALRTAAQGRAEPETSTTSLLARSRSRCVPETFSATSIAASTRANAPGPAEIGFGEDAAKRSSRPKAENSWVSGRPRASKACTSHSSASSRRELSRPLARSALATPSGAERAWSTWSATSKVGEPPSDELPGLPGSCAGAGAAARMSSEPPRAPRAACAVAVAAAMQGALQRRQLTAADGGRRSLHSPRCRKLVLRRWACIQA
mmetsp:Transcript_17473/g.52534  ORF Transcript_17473/g.52534 Transcript_17473/m.52534 type:complete len:207 (+) Transcript_17473:682-1302(+)